jgi:nucleotide-binding universal stress UspA family protein
MHHLSDETLAYLTEVDHHDHEALVAIDPETGHSVGVARFARSEIEPREAEVSVTVADDWQGRGLGTALLERLTERARKEGVHRFTALVQAENRGALALLATLGKPDREGGGPEVRLVIELPDRPGLGAQLARALRAAAAGTLVGAGTLAQRLGDRRARAADMRPVVRQDQPIRTIVVGTDGSATAERAVAAANELAGKLGAEVRVVHAERGNPADALIAAAEEAGADLLVVGSRGMSGAARFLLGSVPDRVSHHAPCSVLIVRTT